MDSQIYLNTYDVFYVKIYGHYGFTSTPVFL